MITETIKKLFSIFDQKEKSQFFFLTFLIIITMFLETFGIGLVIPVVMAVMNRNIFEEPLFNSILPFISELPQLNLIIFTCLILVFFYFLKNLYLLFFLNKEGKYVAGVKQRINSKLFKIYISQKHYSIFKLNTSKLLSNINHDTNVYTYAVSRVLTILADGLVSLGILTLLFVLEPRMLFLNLIIVALGMFFFNFFSKKESKNIGIKKKFYADSFFHKLRNSFDSVKEINIYGKNEYFEKSFDNNVNEISKLEKKFHIINGLPKIIYEFIGIILLIFVIIYFAYTLENSQEMITFLAVVGASAFRLIPSANRIVNSLQYLSFAEKSINILSEEIVSFKNEYDRKKSIIKKDKRSTINFTSIKIDNVSFKYNNREKFVLENVNLKINNGDKILISGKTGSGKSTLIELILGLLKPTSGSIEVDKKCVNKNFKDWSKKIGYVPQKISIIDDTILANIAFGVDKEKIDKNLINKSVDMSELKTFIDTLPKGLDTQVGDMGSKLSGGQIQRLGIARAIYKKPDILILDESTNAVDDDTQKKIIKNLLNDFKNKVLLFISHDNTLSKFITQKLKVENSKLIQA